MKKSERDKIEVRRQADQREKLEKCPTCGAYIRTGIPIQYDGMRIMLQWEGGVLDQRFTFDPRLRQESGGDLPKVYKYIRKVMDLWYEWMEQQFMARQKPKSRIIVPGSPKIIKGKMNIDLGRKP